MNVFKFLIAAIVLGTTVVVGLAYAGAGSDLTQSSAGGGVIVKVTYLSQKATDDPRFQMVLDTHSVDLDAYDLKSIAVLRDDTGKSYFPNVVESKGSGHHPKQSSRFPNYREKRSELNW